MKPIKSLNIIDKVSEIFSLQELIPSAGQGIISLQCREDDSKIISILKKTNHYETYQRASAERNVLKVWEMAKVDGSIKGFSIEGFFAEKAQRPKEPIAEDLAAELSAAKKLLEIKEALIQMSLKKKIDLETYNDYPQGAVNNAKRALKWVEKNGWGSCGEATGKKRANQIANKEKLTRDTIARMASFKRHQQHKDVPYSEGCGGLMWDAWGGSAGINWAISKLKEIDNE